MEDICTRATARLGWDTQRKCTCFLLVRENIVFLYLGKKYQVIKRISLRENSRRMLTNQSEYIVVVKFS